MGLSRPQKETAPPPTLLTIETTLLDNQTYVPMDEAVLAALGFSKLIEASPSFPIPLRSEGSSGGPSPVRRI